MANNRQPFPIKTGGFVALLKGRRSPVLLVAIVLVLLAGGLELVRLLMVYGDDLAPTGHPGTSDLFKGVHSSVKEVMLQQQDKPTRQSQPAAERPLIAAGTGATPLFAPKPAKPLQPVLLPTFEHNLRFGPATAPLTLVVFEDPACGRCRQVVADVLTALAPLQSRMRVVYKYYPELPSSTDGGIFLKMSAQQNKPQFIEQIRASNEDLNTDDFVHMMEAYGISLSDLRTIMGRDMRTFLQQIGQDVQQAQAAGVEASPAFFLNGYKMGGVGGLPIENIAAYAENLLQNGTVQ